VPAVNNADVANDQGALNYKLYTDEPLASVNTRIQNLTDNQQIVQGLLQENLAANLSLSRNATANAIAFSQAVTARAVRFAFDISAEQAAGFVTQIGARLEDRITNLGASLAGLQDFIKASQTTPPQTGTGGAFGSDAGNALLQQLANIQATLQSLESRVVRPA
jgi:hypothetical protein